MADPISFHADPRDLHAADYEQLRNAPHEHAEALLSGYELLQQLHDEGILDIIKGMVGSRDKLLQVLVDAGALPETIRGIRNLIVLAKIAGTLDPKAFEALALAIPEGLAAAKTQEPPGLVSMVKTLSSADSRRALAALTTMLRSMGEALGRDNREGRQAG